ncbi:MAG: acyl-CoA reductase, partial [Candidatus Baltobacteraceae bacterium]
MTALSSVPTRTIATAIGDAATRWCDADFPPRVRVTDDIAARTGYSVPAVEFALDALFGELRTDAFLTTIARELGDPAALDGPAAHIRPLGRVAILSSRTTIGVAIPAMCFALCAKNDVLVKDREDRLVTAFSESLAQEHDAFARALEIATWDSQIEGDRLQGAAAIVVYGSDETVARVTADNSGSARTIGFGSRTSIGYLDAATQASPAELRAALAGAARDSS